MRRRRGSLATLDAVVSPSAPATGTTGSAAAGVATGLAAAGRFFFLGTHDGGSG